VKGMVGPFDGLTIRQIADSVDKYLGCNGDVAGTEDSSEFLKVDSLINVAFSGPIDTSSWSCEKVICTGAKMLMDVAYLRANPNAVPLVIAPKNYYPMNLEPEKYALYQNYPNPFNPSTSIKYSLPLQSKVTLEIFNTLGQRVAQLINAQQQAGFYEQSWNASNVASGMYFYRLTAVDANNPANIFTQVNKMILLR